MLSDVVQQFGKGLRMQMKVISEINRIYVEGKEKFHLEGRNLYVEAKGWSLTRFTAFSPAAPRLIEQFRSVRLLLSNDLTFTVLLSTAPVEIAGDSRNFDRFLLTVPIWPVTPF
jgi:hypothetical protein